jgi:S-adenosylmethionine:tRNA ribosyltransferase-isomerase
MLRSDFRFELPEDLIASRPPEQRGDSRLLQVDAAHGRLTDRTFTELPELLRAGDLLVVNDTRVVPARLRGRKPSGGRVELLLERVTGADRALVQLRASKPPAVDGLIVIDGGPSLRVVGRSGDFWEIDCGGDAHELFEHHGEVPLPPYIQRPAESGDRDRYQTVFARERGAVAAPTAGLHFDEAMLARIRSRGVEVGAITLHVGAGTFQPVRVDDLAEHRMHSERVRVSAGVCAEVTRARAAGGRVIAVGTTVVRALETAAASGTLAPYDAETRLFITPGYRFRVVDALLTNFHLPESTLLMLVAAFGGIDCVLAAYRHAVRSRYRFFSYGDAMFVEPARDALAPRDGA